MRRNSDVRMWLTEPLSPDVRRSIERLERLEDVQRIAVMPDVHLGERVCIGCALATRELIYPAAVGSDIGCGYAAMALRNDQGMSRDLDGARTWISALRESVPVMRQRSLSGARGWPPGLRPEDLSRRELAALARREGQIELGTLGRGNHFLELQIEDDNTLWLMVHSGSRAMGQAITRLHVSGAERGRSGMEFLAASEEAGLAYLRDVEWAERYAAANRQFVLLAAAEVAARVLGGVPDWGMYIDCNHNHVQLEDHAGERLFVHRKGANVASAGVAALIPGCMGGESFHVVGRGEEAALCSSSHGAGRRLSRRDASRRISTRELLQQMEGAAIDVQSAPSLREEAPGAYKDIRAVMRAQRDLVRIARVVRGLATYKGVG
jgi:tRNA-splicing ligase RtcB (3'-phosphate/5'-hydroxy nucleic acid ligase)